MKLVKRREAIVLASRLLAVLLTIWALAEVSYLPTSLYSFLRYSDQGGGTSSIAMHYWHHHYLMSLGFLIIRIVGYTLIASWFYRCGPDIEELLLPTPLREEVEN